MRIGIGFLVVGLMGMAGIDGMAAQEPARAATAGKPSDIVTLSGCVTPDADSRKGFTLADATQDQTYRLTGTDMRDFVGQHVEIFGNTSKRLRIVGGLYPSPNVAAHAQGNDPTKAAMAAQSGPTANMSRPSPEFRVKSVRVTPGDCAKE
jgi:hypothetical protein